MNCAIYFTHFILFFKRFELNSHLADIFALCAPVNGGNGEPVVTRSDQPRHGQVNLEAWPRKGQHPA
jgi:hypothetical protein